MKIVDGFLGIIKFIPFFMLTVPLLIKYTHPGYDMFLWWVVLFPFNLHWIFLILPNKALMIASLIPLLKSNKLKFLIFIIAIHFTINFRWIAIYDRLFNNCHSPYCLFDYRHIVNYLIFTFYLTLSGNYRSRLYFYSYHFVLIFWHTDLITFSVFWLNYLSLRFGFNAYLWIYWRARIRQVIKYVRVWSFYGKQI